MVDKRKIREKALQDQRFRTKSGSRGGSRQAYTITAESHGYYKRRLEQDCSGKRLLEIGCASGHNVFELCRRGAIVTGIDLSDVAIDMARSAAREAGESNATFVAGDAEQTHFPPNSFDIVCGGAILHHLSTQRAYAEISRVLEPAGYALFVEPLGRNPFINMFRRVTPWMRTPDEHPLVEGDLQLAREYFGTVSRRYYYLTTLLALPIARSGFGQRVIRVLNGLDRRLFGAFPALQTFAWIVVLEFRDPKKEHTVSAPAGADAEPSMMS